MLFTEINEFGALDTLVGMIYPEHSRAFSNIKSIVQKILYTDQSHIKHSNPIITTYNRHNDNTN